MHHEHLHFLSIQATKEPICTMSNLSSDLDKDPNMLETRWWIVFHTNPSGRPMFESCSIKLNPILDDDINEPCIDSLDIVTLNDQRITTTMKKISYSYIKGMKGIPRITRTLKYKSYLKL